MELHQSQVKDSFSAKWARVSDFGYSPSASAVMRDWMFERYGWDLESFKKFISQKKSILDAGMGNGWFAALCAENTTGEVYGVDFSDSVEAAALKLAKYPNAHAIRADVMDLPFRKEQFDFIISHGVLHHTENTEQAFKNLVNYLAPGGEIAIYVYRKKGPVREFCDDYIRGYTTGMSAEECYKFCESITRLGKSLTEQSIKVNIPENIRILDFPAGEHDLQRFFYWNILKCYWRPEWDFETNVSVNFDWYHPYYAHRHTPEEVTGWFKEGGLEIFHTGINESGIAMRGKK